MPPSQFGIERVEFAATPEIVAERGFEKPIGLVFETDEDVFGATGFGSHSPQSGAQRVAFFAIGGQSSQKVSTPLSIFLPIDWCIAVQKFSQLP